MGRRLEMEEDRLEVWWKGEEGMRVAVDEDVMS